MLNRLVPALAALAIALAAGACEPPDPELQPDAVLRDSLGLGDGDRVHTVVLSVEDGRETAEPSTVQVRPGDLVQFVADDRRPRAVAFLVDSLAGAAAAFLRESGQEGSPPLVESDSRFLVSFRDAPAGRYPFVIDGTGAPLRGAVVVSTPERGG